MSLFANATKLPTNSTKVKNTDKDVVELPGLEAVAKITAIAKTFETLAKEASASLKDEVVSDKFYDAMVETGKSPENFKAEDGIATASIECRKRSENSALTDEEVEQLEKFQLTPEKRVIKQELWAINPAYVSDTSMMKKVDKLLEGKVPKDFFAFQAEESKPVVTEELMEKACAMKHKLPKEVFSLLVTLAIKPKLEVTDIKSLFNEMKSLLGIEDTEEEIAKSPVKRATRKLVEGGAAKGKKKVAAKA